MPVKVGYPRGFRGGLIDIIDNPAYATVLGLILFGLNGIDSSGQILRGERQGVFKGIANNLKSLFKDFM